MQQSYVDQYSRNIGHGLRKFTKVQNKFINYRIRMHTQPIVETA